MTNTYNRDLHTHTIKEYKVQKDTTARDFSIGLTAGLIVGSFIGLLVAPKSGKALQQDLNDKAETLKAKSTEHYNKQLENAQGFKEKSADFTAKLSEKTAAIKEKVTQKSDNHDHVTADELKRQKDAIKEEVNDDTLTEPIAIVDKALDTPIKNEALKERYTTIDMAKDAETKAKNK
ncbi:YtxH domain-containing protein [Macrococcoides caseolyticum]|uniref:YtxH domain-containing protein n=1 Tax=Macrococcoides caseolyticum TaxID=69966 RepID=UPI001F472E0A|nr:YtxH domain-containing protein [Macrococcus caseolyticus]MCE4956368.1 YtxH domain-containing protein [Macrococcus caseolyticus]